MFNTDVVLTGLRTVRTAKAEDAAAQAKRDAEAKKAADFHRLSEAGAAALDQKQYDRAVKTLSEASQIKPDDVKVLTALTKAKHEQAAADLARQSSRRRQHAAKKAERGGAKATRRSDAGA